MLVESCIIIVDVCAYHKGLVPIPEHILIVEQGTLAVLLTGT